MTLNQILRRIKKIALAHKQVRNFQTGSVSDFLGEHTTKYPSVFLQYSSGNISTARHQASISYRMFVVDLVHAVSDGGENFQDVESDTLSIALDLVAQLNDSNFFDWRLSTDNNLQLVTEGEGDQYAGVVVDFSIATIFEQDRCKIPSDLINDFTDNETDMKLVFDEKYVATGTEGNLLTTTGEGAHIPFLNGKKVLFISRESSPIYKVSSNPDQAEYVWNNLSVLLGTVTNPGERFLFLFRNY